MVQFPYERVEANPSFADPALYVFRPVVPITIFGLTTSFPVQNGLIDPAFRQGETGQLFGADGHPFDVRYGTVDLAIKLKRKIHRWHAKVAFHPMRKDVLLGDAGFLRYFVATFNRPESYATLRPSGKLPLAIMPV